METIASKAKRKQFAVASSDRRKYNDKMQSKKINGKKIESGIGKMEGIIWIEAS